MSVRYPGGGAKQVAGFTSVGSQGELRVKETNWESSVYWRYLRPCAKVRAGNGSAQAEKRKWLQNFSILFYHGWTLSCRWIEFREKIMSWVPLLGYMWRDLSEHIKQAVGMSLELRGNFWVWDIKKLSATVYLICARCQVHFFPLYFF